MLEINIRGKKALVLTDDNQNIVFDKDVVSDIRKNTIDGHEVELTIKDTEEK